MKEIVTYALGVVVCSGVLTLFYRVALHRRIPFSVARIYLLASMFVAALIPALRIPVWRVSPVEAAAPIAIPLDGFSVALTAVTPVDWGLVAMCVLWSLGIATLGVVMVCQAVRIARIRRRAEVYSLEGCRVAVSSEISSPFSFLGTVYVESGTTGEMLAQIMLHERSHIRHRHSQEKIAMETAKILLWFNPFGWWAARLLAEVHEFEADRDVLDGGFTVEQYLELIFRQIFGYIPEISVGLGDSLTKKRFLMMRNKMKHTKFGVLRVAGALPLAAGLMALFSFTNLPPEIIYPDSPAVVETAVVETVEIPASQPAPQEPQKADQDVPIYNAEQMPVFEGGDLNDFRNWVQGKLSYPREAVANRIQGTVTLKFVIEKDGSLSSVEEIASPGKVFTDEAVRVVGSSPKWTPGTNKGKPVRVFYILPVQFRLEKEAEPAAQTPPNSADTPIYNAEQMPTFQGGGLNAFRYWAQQRLIYPKEAIENNISGVVTVKYVVERDGSVSNIEIIGSPHKLLSDEAVRVVGLSPKWTPGTQKGRPVRVYYILPLQFKLESDNGPIPPIPTAESAEKPNMSEITVVGYGTQRRGSESTPLPSANEVVYLRSDKADGQPMIILDGREIEQMKTVDPNTIESITVLKDAAALEKYGERGKDGVIIITSKKEGDPSEIIRISAEKGTDMSDIHDIKQFLREKRALKVTYASPK
jgi:TonB family protein